VWQYLISFALDFRPIRHTIHSICGERGSSRQVLCERERTMIGRRRRVANHQWVAIRSEARPDVRYSSCSVFGDIYRFVLVSAGVCMQAIIG
jgi:hypothetical protein